MRAQIQEGRRWIVVRPTFNLGPANIRQLMLEDLVEQIFRRQLTSFADSNVDDNVDDSVDDNDELICHARLTERHLLRQLVT